MLTLRWRGCWLKRPPPPAPHRRIAIPSNDVDPTPERWDGYGLKGASPGSEWGIGGELRDVARGRGAGAAADPGPRETLTSCPGKAKGREFGTKAAKGQVRSLKATMWPAAWGRSRRMFPTGEAFSPLAIILPPLKKRATGHPGPPFLAPDAIDSTNHLPTSAP